MVAGRRILSFLLAFFLTVTLTACGSAGSDTANAGAADAGAKTVNIGATDEVGTLNPLKMDMSFINHYSAGLVFLPLVSFSANYGLNYLLADSITTEDNRTFTIHIKDSAAWSDGEAVKSDDVIFTYRKLSTAEIRNVNFNFSILEGINGDGTWPEGKDSVSGLKKIDDKTLEVKTVNSMGLNTFINGVASWVNILPSHALKDIPDEELLSSPWFDSPDVVSGPYMISEFVPGSHVYYKSNENYFMGAPKIGNLNIICTSPKELLTKLKSGELDFVHPAMANFQAEDRKELESLKEGRAFYADPITNEMTFFNTRKIPDARVRKAFVLAIDRERILEEFLDGKGEISDGFICSKSPYFDEEKKNIPYDPAEAKRLLAEAGWDSGRTLEYYVNSSDISMVRTAEEAKKYLAEVGIEINVHSVDFPTLMELGGSDEVDVFSVQYTVLPIDYYSDEASLINSDPSWTGGYTDAAVAEALMATQNSTDEAKIKAAYNAIDRRMIEDVPMFSMYFVGNIGVVGDRLMNAEPTFYGAFDNIQEWDLELKE